MKSLSGTWRSTLLTSLFMCAGALISIPLRAQSTPIRVGYTITTDIASAALFNAQKKGLFKQAGLDIQTQPFVQSSKKYDAFKGKAIDVDINAGGIEAAQLFAAGVPIVVLKAIQPADFWAVVVKSTSTAKGPADFKGKPYGVVSLAGTNFGATYLAFKIDNVDLMRDVKVSVLPPAGLIAALQNGSIEGATLYEPYLSQAIRSGSVKEIFRPITLYQRHYGATLFALNVTARKDFYLSNTAAVSNFLAILESESRALPQNLAESSKALSEAVPALKESPAQVEALLKPYASDYIQSQNEPVFLTQVQAYYDRLYDIKQIPRQVRVSDFWIKP
jgi:ABC-type nitrate/sulfonate/bicarbonate transport system substrate-binding protein